MVGTLRHSRSVSFSNLLTPGQIGPLSLRNRILMCPMGDNLGNEHGTVSERQLEYYEARARGGAALLLVGSVAVGYPHGTYDRRQLGASDPRFVPGLRALAARAHRHGALIAAQLVHDGPNSLADISAGRPLLVPSVPSRPASDPLSALVTGEEMEALFRPFSTASSRLDVRVADDDDLAWVVDQFADAAGRCVEAGFDGIEIHAGHGYLIDAFLSPASNRRTDSWGGPVEGRARLLREVVAAVRAAVGASVAVWLRLNGEERFRPGGTTVDDAIAAARIAVVAGADAVHVSVYADPGVAIGITGAHTPHAPGALVGLAAEVRAAVSVPVITFGRLEPSAAEAALVSGAADFVAMGRKLLADPDLPRRLASGSVADVRPCIYRYRCIGNIFLGEPVACVVNPATGHESELRVVAAAVGRRVAVVGGGPAGLEAARLLAERGHEVSLYESGPRLGGRLALAARVDEALDRFLAWQLRGVERASVSIELGRAVTVDELDADEIVVATGGRWHPSLDAIARWLEADDGSVGARVLVRGDGSAALGLARLCASRGREVVVEAAVPGTDLGLPGRFRIVHELQEMGVRFVTEHDGDADTVIDTTVTPGVVAAGRPVHAIGDCTGFGGLEAALESAVRLAVSL